MPVADLSHVSESLHRLLHRNVRRLMGNLPASALTVIGMPPERVSATSNTLNLYLYHVSEDPFYKNAPGAGDSTPDVAHAPMALSLYYILTAHNGLTDNTEAMAQQRILGYAIKTMHDFPVVTDDTALQVDASDTPPTILHDDLLGGDNRIEVTLRPVTPEEALSFWAAEDQRTAQLSAYYEVRVIMLEPEPAQRFAAPVLSVGRFVIPMGGPRLVSSRSTVGFTPPASSGFGPQQIDAEPARVFLDDPLAVDRFNVVRLTGSGLTAGRSRRVVLRHARWAALTPSVDRVPLDLDLAVNVAAGWEAQFHADGIELAVGNTVSFDDGAGATRTIDVSPGIYGVSIEAVMAERVVAGRTRQVIEPSNEIAISVGPWIAADAGPDPVTGRMSIDVAPRLDLAVGAGTADELEVGLVVRGQVYERTASFTGTVAQDEGRFVVSSTRVEFHPFVDAAGAGDHPVRLLVNGAESQPYWIER